MKTNITVISFLLLVKLSLGQDPCVNQANTFPGVTPTPIYLQNIPFEDSKFLNNWIYWMTLEDPNTSSSDYLIPIYNMGMNPGEYYGDSPETPPMTGMQQPLNSQYFQNYYNYLSRFTVYDPNKNIYDYIHPENGWELLSVNRGWYPDNTTPTVFGVSQPLRPVPYILIYNKYSGIARIYVRYGNNAHPDATINFADITIQHQNNDAMTGMLRLGDGLDRTLDQKSLIKKLRMRVPSPGDASLWFSADFQMHYDPCVCEYDSKIQVLFHFYSVANLTLHGRSVTVEGEATSEPLMDAASNFLDFNGTFNSTLGTASDGFVIYQHYASLVDDYLEKLNHYKTELDDVNRHNKEIDRQVAVLKIAKGLLSTGVTIATGGMPGFLSLLALIPNVKQAYDNKGGVFDKDVQKEFFKELDKVLSLGFDFFIKENFKKKDNPTKPTMPTASITEMHISGQIENGSFNNGPNINTPGSKNAHDISDVESQFEFPVYNEALGVFALLEKPKLKISDKHHDFSWEIWKVDNVSYLSGIPFTPFWVNNNTMIGYPEFKAKQNIQIALNEPLKFTFNPALKIVNYNIDVSFDVSASVKSKSLQQLTPNIGYNNVYPHQVIVESKNFSSHNVNISGQSFEYDNESNKFLRKVDSELSSCENTLDSIIRFNTIPVSIDAVNSMIYSFGSSHSIKYPDVFRHRSNGLSQGFPFLPVYPVSIMDRENHLPICVSSGAHRMELFNSDDIDALYDSPMGCAMMYYNAYSSDPLIQFHSVNPNYYSTADYPKVEIDAIVMKLVVDVEFEGNNLDGTRREYTYMFSYEIDMEDILTHGVDEINWDNLPQILSFANHQLNPNLAGSSQDFTQFGEVVVFNEPWFNGQQIENCVLVGNHYECKSHYSIEIQGDVAVEPNYTVRFVAPEIITVLSETTIAPEVELVIEPIFDLSNPTPPQNSVQVASFCVGESKKYEANQLQRSIAAFIDSIAQANPTPQPEPTPIEFIVFPNPTTGASQAGLVLPELSTVSISIIDITGKVQGRPVRNQVLPVGRNVLNLESEPLAPGVYFVQVVVNGEKLTQRLVKQ